MRWFALVYVGILATTHLYLYFNFRRALGGGWWRVAALAYIAAVFLYNYPERGWTSRHSWGPLAQNMYDYCLGFAVVACTIFLIGDGLRLVFWVVGKATGATALQWAFSRRFALTLLCIAFLAYFYALYEARAYRIVRLEIATELLPEGRDRVRIAAFSDLHLDRLNGEKQLRRVVDMINAERPDVVAVLGDTVDTDMRARENEAAIFRELAAPHRFAVIGNHEVFRGLHQGVEFLEKSGLSLLRGDSTEAAGILVVGVDDPIAPNAVDAAQALAGADQGKFVLLLSHRPRVPDGARGRFDLQVSGHTHGGQLFVARPLARWLHGHPQGLSVLPPGTAGGKTGRLYVLNGVGFWGPPTRLFVPPDILVVDLVRP